MKNSSVALACPLCYNHFSHSRNIDGRKGGVFGFGLDFRAIPRDCSLSADIATCPDCLFTAAWQIMNGESPDRSET